MPEPTSPTGPAATPAPARAPAAPAAKPAVSASTFANSRRGTHFGNDTVDKTPEELETVQVQAADESEAPSEAESEPEVEAQPEDAGEESSEDAPEAGPYPADIHGVPLADVLAALQEGRLPDELWQALKMELVDGEDREVVPLSEYRDGAMMHRNFSRKSMALAKDRKEMEATKAANDAEQQEFYGMVRNWKTDDEAFYRGARSLGLPLEKVALRWATEYERKSKLSPEQFQAEEATEARERDLEKRARELRTREAKLKETEGTHTEAQVSKEAKTFEKFIIGHMPDAFANVGISLESTTPEQAKLNKIILDRFKDVLGVYWTDGTQPTKEMVQHAARATAELLGIKKPKLVPAPPLAKPAPGKPAVAAKPAPKALAGTASYDPGKASSPARQQLSARSLQAKLAQVRRSSPAR